MAAHDMDSRELRDARDQERYERVLEASGPSAAEYLSMLWGGTEWLDDGQINQWEIADQLEQIAPHLREVLQPAPAGWNPFAQTAFRSALITLTDKMAIECHRPANGAMRMVGDVPQYWADSLKRWVTIPDD
jgi:hypothetical protein